MDTCREHTLMDTIIGLFHSAPPDEQQQIVAVLINEVPQPPAKRQLREDAKDILAFLNTKAQRNFRPVKVNLEFIMHRLQEGATAGECKQIVAMKSRCWAGTELEPYLRPATLFNRSKFWQYHGELRTVQMKDGVR